MDKKTNIILWGSGVLVAVIAGVVWWRFSPAPEEKISDAVQGVAIAENAQASIADSVGKVNPFSADVNPVGGYVNPFE